MSQPRIAGRSVAIIQARTTSTRFPNKVLADLAGKPLIQHVIERTARIRGLDDLCVTIPEGDDALHEVLDALGVPVCLGPEYDVLARYAMAADQRHAATVIRVTGDCPLFDPTIADAVLTLYHADPFVEYASNVAPGYIDGTDVEVFSHSALSWANRAARDAYDREHVTSFIRRNCKKVTLPPAFDAEGLKTSIDCLSDLDAVRILYASAQRSS